MQNIFYHPIIIDELRGAEKKYTITTSTKQNQHIAQILKVVSIKELSATIYLRQQNNYITIDGSIKTTIEQESVISLDVFDKKHNIDFNMLFDKSLNYQKQRELENEGKDAPDIIINGKIDLADIIIEQIALNLDEYPKKPNEVFELG